MRSLFVVVALAVSLLTTVSTAAFAQETLTNQSIMEMLKAGLSERVGIAKLRTSAPSFHTSTDALSALTKSGGREKVSEAMRSPAAAAAAPAPPPAAPAGSVAMAPPPAAGYAPARPTVYQIVGGKEVELMASGGEVQRNR